MYNTLYMGTPRTITRSTCNDCGRVFEKRGDNTAELNDIGRRMVAYLARRHREKTGHTTSPITESPEVVS
jgi:hypothetical protein